MSGASVLIRPVLEKVEQAHIVQFARSLGGMVYVLGNHRRAGDYQGTMQTPGLPDLWIWLPPGARRTETGGTVHLPPMALWWEVKAARRQRRREQIVFGEQCQMAGTPYGYGTFDAFIGFMAEHGRIHANQVPHYRQPVRERE